jgi:tetratricopeptide (TPR) repeat protein
MLSSKISKPIIMSAFLASLLTGCGPTYSGPPSDKAITPEPSSRQVMQEQASQSQAPVPPASRVPAFGTEAPPESREVKLDAADIEFVRHRLDEYGKKFEYWLEFSEMAQEEKLAEEVTALEPECMQKLERILSGYSLLLEKMQKNDTIPLDQLAAVDPKKIQQLDIAFLESRCGELLAMDIPAQHEVVPEPKPKLSFDAAQKVIAAKVEQGRYQEALSAYGQLALDFPDQKPFLATRLNYGLALQYNGQVEAAARHFTDLLESGELSIDPIRLQREIADLLLASGNVAAAESYYDKVIQGYGSIGAEKTWAEEQLAFLASVDPGSAGMAAYVKLLREFQTYDYRIDAPRLNEAIQDFAVQYAGTPFAVSALRLKTFAPEQMRSWFERQLIKIDYLVSEKRFTEAIDILKSMTRYYFPADLQAILQKTYYEVAQAEIEAREVQRRMQEIEFTKQWETATNLLESQRYDPAISAFEALMGTEYEEQAKIKITEASNLAASQMRKEAASLFVRAGKTMDPEQKKVLLLASHRLLTEIPTKYPQTDLLDKVEQNIAILEMQIMRFDPALLEELQQGNPAPLPFDPPAPDTRQLQ